LALHGFTGHDGDGSSPLTRNLAGHSHQWEEFILAAGPAASPGHSTSQTFPRPGSFNRVAVDVDQPTGNHIRIKPALTASRGLPAELSSSSGVVQQKDNLSGQVIRIALPMQDSIDVGVTTASDNIGDPAHIRRDDRAT
jgi:hypothetical protein